MESILQREAITTGQRGTRVPLARLCQAVASNKVTVPVANSAQGMDQQIDDDLLCRLLLSQLLSVGFSAESESAITSMTARLRLSDVLRRWLEESIRLLASRGYLRGDVPQVLPARAASSRDPWAEWETRSRVWAQNSDLRAQVVLLDAMLRALPRILSGAVLATDIMFPNSSMELVEGIYKNNPVTDCFNEIMAEAVVAVLQEIVRGNSSARIRIIEIGAGTGGGSLRVLEKLKPFASHVETYCYTDVSKSFLMHAEKEYGPKFPYLDYQLFNVEEPLAKQGVALGTYDIALATNVLHATRDIRKTLRNAKAVLKESGVLLVNELSAHSLFTHLTFGLLEGWWLYEDAELRIPGCPGLSPESWQDVLEQEGFGSISFPALALHHLGHQILAADSDGLIRQALPRMPESMGPDVPKAAKPVARRESPQPPLTQPAAHTLSVTDEALERHVKEVIFEQLKQSLKIDKTQIAEDDAFMDYGIDSILGVQLIQEINKKLAIGLATTDLFDHGSISQLARHIVSAYRAESIASLPRSLSLPAAEPAPLTAVPSKSEVAPARDVPVLQEIADAVVLRKEPIAIVGMSGRYGRSNSLEALWEHLAEGHDLIEEVSRWDLSRYYPAGAKYCKYGSFIDGIDTFDPVFFKMSGLEATYMDPQQRVFLEESWKALEDAGYAGPGVQGRRCGVYVGCQESGYAQLFSGEAPAQAMWGNALSAMPARISYFLDLQGPAISIDTACSSSLVAIHLACQGLWAGETEMALAGGISIQCTPKFYLIANQAGMLSASGRCHTFDDRADGFVPGEGVGVVVLKRLSDALADGDHIYGVIRGSGINQDGTSNGITAPSAKSQERLETSVYDAFGINPEGIQMMEAHGTGTKLGDPIEYHALKRAFGKYTKQKDFCALGSIKTNIGHTITAAGVAGVIKVLLSLKHGRIPPSLHFEKGNAHIGFADSPFYVNTTNRPWEVVGGGKRCAAVSSFGVSGTNAHVVIEEAPRRAQRAPAQAAHLITLSAGTVEQLREQAERFIAHCKRERELDLGDVSFTLLLGRKHLPHRLACVARNQAELIHGLQLWLTKGQGPQIWVGEVPEQGPREQASLKGYGNECIRKSGLSTDSESLAEMLSAVADLYVQGYRLDFAGLFAARQHVRVPLPTYPFARERYWVPEAQAEGPSHALKAAVLHPLVHINVSSFQSQRYQSTFTGDEFFLRDHKVKGQKVLPGVACLEMARAAAAFAMGETGRGGGQGIALRNVVWARPVTASQGSKTLTTALTLKGQNEIEYEISSPADDSADAGALSRVHCQGQAFLKACAPATLDIQRIKAACDKTELRAAQLYPAYEQIGFEYGSSHRGIECLHIGRDEVLVQLSLPSSVRATRDVFVLHPSLLDATLQASLGMGLAAGKSSSLDVADMKPSLPFALDELEILGGCTESMWAWIRYSAGIERGGRVFKLDIDLCDDQGRVRARMKGMSYRTLDGEVGEKAPPASCVSFLPKWERQSVGVPEMEPLRHVVLLPDMPGLASAIEAQGPSVQALRLTSAAAGIAERFTDYAVQALVHVQRILDSKPQQKVLMQLVVPEEPVLSVIQGLLGLLKSAQMEEPKLLAQAVLVDTGESVGRLVSQLTAGHQHAGDACIRFRGGEAEVLTWIEDGARPEVRIPWKNGGVYLITGGLGGIATLVAKDMIAQVQDLTLVLVGRSPLRAEQEDVLKAWRAQGANVSYESVDVSQARAVDALIGRITREHGALHGIIHSAGVTKDNFIKRKTPQECREVLGPKVAGLVNLDNASKDVKLDFLVMFAGGAGVFGNVGQADYAAANAFLDAYAHYRQGLVAQGQRFGASVSIDWPLWAEGGMRVDGNTETMMRERLGMLPMATATGIGALYASLNAAYAQVMFIAGDAKRIKRAVLHTPPRHDPAHARSADSQPAPAASANPRATNSKLIAYLKRTLSDVIQIPAHRIDAAAPFERYGIDSVLALTLTNKLEAAFGSLSKTLFFEYQTIDDLSRYFLDAHASRLETVLGISAAPEKPAALETLRDTPKPVAAAQPPLTLPAKERAPQRQPEPTDDAVAIIGLSGRYPQAKDLGEFWSNLVAGRDGITEVPADRWDHRLYYDAEKNQPGKTPNKWGGFIDGVADFDPLFFNISPREAAIMDPQTRLFLECVWNLLESSGHTRETLQSKYQSRVGVYVGAMYQQYQLLPSDIVHESITSILSYSAIANRASHFFNLQGPSLAIDTTCSSSLVAIHMACEELRRGNCELMIAGGVNLSLHPKKYLGLSLTGLTGSNLDSRAFLDGDGFIPGEGVGAVLLKPLSHAVRDGDEILAVIRSSAMNHKGRTNGPMVPSPEQQAQLIESNLRRAGVHPRTISYVEAAANGSPLGDAIEFAALNKVFGKYTQDEQFCALGTVKSTLGNAEAASGVAQLSKVVLQLRHKKLVPLVRRGKLNPHLALKGTAFYLPQEVMAWQRPVVSIDGQEREYPRRATISAFGAGGANAHLVIEEYVAADAVEQASQSEIPTPQIVVLSARNKDRLRIVARQMLEFVSAQRDVSLADLAHTLQRGREAMASRLAMVVGSMQELIAGLSNYLQGSETATTVPLFTGEVRHDKSELGALLSGRVGDAVLKELLAENKPENLALFWAQGGHVPWESIPREGRAPRMMLTLPTYPFDRKRYWVTSRPESEGVTAEPSSGVAARPAADASAERPAGEGIVAIVADLLGVPASRLDVNARLEDYGFNSMLALQLVKRIQTDFDPGASLAALTECGSTQDLIRRFARASSGATPRTPAAREHTPPLSAALARFPEIIPLNLKSTGRPVFWFHGGLGGLEVYGAIAPSIERPFYGIQARGWMTSSAPLQGISAMATYYAQIIQAVQPEGPYDLGGYSLGGLLAYEVTRQLQEQGKTVETIVMLDAMWSDAIKTMTMSRKDMFLQLVNALLFASVKPAPADFKATFITSSEVDWEQNDDALLEQLVALAQKRGLNRPAEALRGLIKQNVGVQEAYEVLKYEVLPLPRPESVTCFYFRNKSGLFYGELESVFSTQADGKRLDHMDYWGEWQKQMPNFYRRDVDSSNHFVMLSEASSLLTIQKFCEMFYSEIIQESRTEIAKKWISQN